MIITAQQKDAIIESRGQSKQVVLGTRKYVVRLKNGKSFTCIDLVKDDPDEVEAMLRAQFAHYGVESITR